MNIESLSVSNAAGTLKSMLDVEKACGNNAMTAITVGSITVKPRKGNIADSGHGRVYYYDQIGGWSLNSLGLPNYGIEEYMKLLPSMARKAHGAGRELRVSVAGESPQEYADLTDECYKCAADVVELNLGCPNVWGDDGAQKPIPSYRPELTKRILLTVRTILASGRKVDVKISPVEEPFTLRELALAIANSRCVGNVVGTNTIPNQERLGSDFFPALSFNDGNHLGGLAGRDLYSESLRVHHKMRQHLSPEIGYIAVGGISNGGAMLAHLKQGAIGFQSGTGYYQEGPRVFTPILSQLADLVEQLA